MKTVHLIIKSHFCKLILLVDQLSEIHNTEAIIVIFILLHVLCLIFFCLCYNVHFCKDSRKLLIALVLHYHLFDHFEFKDF